MNTTIKELADIGAEAALKALTDESSAMTIDSGRHHSFNQDRPAREAFAGAIVEAQKSSVKFLYQPGGKQFH